MHTCILRPTSTKHVRYTAVFICLIYASCTLPGCSPSLCRLLARLPVTWYLEYLSTFLSNRTGQAATSIVLSSYLPFRPPFTFAIRHPCIGLSGEYDAAWGLTDLYWKPIAIFRYEIHELYSLILNSNVQSKQSVLGDMFFRINDWTTSWYSGT